MAELALPRDAAMPLSNGDVLFAFSAAEVVPSTQNQNKRVRVDGEVLRPGEYVLPPGSTLGSLREALAGRSARHAERKKGRPAEAIVGRAIAAGGCRKAPRCGRTGIHPRGARCRLGIPSHTRT